jgi:hypothetical protein
MPVLEPVKVDMAKITDDTKCRAEAQTGSRIAVRRCYSESEAAARTPAEEYILRQNIEEMRQREFLRQQAEAVRAAALRQGRMPPQY